MEEGRGEARTSSGDEIMTKVTERRLEINALLRERFNSDNELRKLM